MVIEIWSSEPNVMGGGKPTAFRGEVRVPKAAFMQRLPLPVTTFPLMPRAHQAASDPYLVLEYVRAPLPPSS